MIQTSQGTDLGSNLGTQLGSALAQEQRTAVSAAFASGALTRAFAGVAFAIGATALAITVETMPLGGQAGRAPAPAQGATQLAAPAIAPAPQAAASGRLRIESTFTVSAWHVRVGGRELAASGTGDGQSWRGLVPVGAELVVSAEPGDPTDLTLHALRLSWPDDAGQAPATAFGSGAVTCVVPAAAGGAVVPGPGH